MKLRLSVRLDVEIHCFGSVLAVYYGCVSRIFELVVRASHHIDAHVPIRWTMMMDLFVASSRRRRRHRVTCETHIFITRIFMRCCRFSATSARSCAIVCIWKQSILFHIFFSSVGRLFHFAARTPKKWYHRCGNVCACATCVYQA